MSKYPTALQSRFSEFIVPLPFEKNDKGGDISTSNGDVLPNEYSASCSSSGNNADHVLCPSVKKEMMLECFMLSLPLAAALSVTSPTIVSHFKQWIWNWGQVLLAHFCCLVVSRFIVAFGVLRIQTSSMHFAFQYLTYSFAATAWFSLLIIIVCFLVEKFEVDGDSAALFFEFLRTLSYMFIVGQMGFHVFQSIYLHWMFRPWMHEAASHLYVLEALMGPPLSEDKREKMEADPVRGALKKFEQMSMAAFSMDNLLVVHFPSAKGWITEVADMMQLVLHTFGVNSQLRDAVDRKLWAKMDGFRESKFKSSSQSKIVEEARQAFWHVASPGNRFIDREDVLRFLTKDDVEMIFLVKEKSFGGGKIDEWAFQEWVVETYRLRKSLVHAITDAKIMMSNLYKFAMTSFTVMFLMPSLVKGVIPAAVLVSFIPQVCVLCYVFWNTVKSFFDSLLFVFVAHPFDAGDCCKIDGIQMVVEEMNIANTVFLGFDNVKIRYPNSRLLAKPIINHSRNSDIGEKIEFSIASSTPDETVDELRTHIKEYLRINEKHWQENHSLLMEGIEEGKLKMNLNVLHRMNYHNFPEMKKHRSELLFTLKDIFERLNIKEYVFRCSPTPNDPMPNLGSKTPSSYSNTELLPKPFSNYIKNSDMYKNLEKLKRMCMKLDEELSALTTTLPTSPDKIMRKRADPCETTSTLQLKEKHWESLTLNETDQGWQDQEEHL